MIIETERLILRPVTIKDTQDIYNNSKEIEVGINAGWKPHASIEETKKIMREIFLSKEYIFAIENKESKKVIGTIGIIDDPKRLNDKSRMLGYSIGKDYWGEGFMTEAAKAVCNAGFNTLNLDIISAYCYPNNKRSKRVLEKCGFEYEGCLRLSEVLFNGTVADNECYSCLNPKL